MRNRLSTKFEVGREECESRPYDMGAIIDIVVMTHDLSEEEDRKFTDLYNDLRDHVRKALESMNTKVIPEEIGEE